MTPAQRDAIREVATPETPEERAAIDTQRVLDLIPGDGKSILGYEVERRARDELHLTTRQIGSILTCLCSSTVAVEDHQDHRFFRRRAPGELSLMTRRRTAPPPLHPRREVAR